MLARLAGTQATTRSMQWPIQVRAGRRRGHLCLTCKRGSKGAPSGNRSKTTKVRSLDTVSRCWPLGEKAIWVTVRECASRGGPTDVHVATSHSHTAANCAACACTPHVILLASFLRDIEAAAGRRHNAFSQVYQACQRTFILTDEGEAKPQKVPGDSVQSYGLSEKSRQTLCQEPR